MSSITISSTPRTLISDWPFPICGRASAKQAITMPSERSATFHLFREAEPSRASSGAMRTPNSEVNFFLASRPFHQSSSHKAGSNHRSPSHSGFAKRIKAPSEKLSAAKTTKRKEPSIPKAPKTDRVRRT